MRVVPNIEDLAALLEGSDCDCLLNTVGGFEPSPLYRNAVVVFGKTPLVLPGRFDSELEKKKSTMFSIPITAA